MNSEAFYYIIDNNDPGTTTNELSVSVSGSMLTAQSCTAYMRRLILRDGFDMVELTRIADLLSVDRLELATRLMNTPNQGGMDIYLIDEIMALYNRTIIFQQGPDGNYTYVFVPLAVVVVPKIVHPVLTSVPAPEDDPCAICLQINANEWSTAAGCSFHRFHTECISQWTRGSCPVCRKVLRGALGE